MGFSMVEMFDTNLILRLVLRDMPEQCLKIQDLLMRKGATYDIADLAVTEAVYVLQKGNSRGDIVEMLQFVLGLPHIRANFNLFDRVFPMYLEHPKLSFNDCCLAVYAQLNGATPLWTTDHKLAHQSPTAKLLV